MAQAKTQKPKKTSKAKKQAFNDMRENHEFPFLPFDRWMNRYVFS
tara:strand:- start:40286 stop:40420 length:135 start_codon:yes stop_codon:yes gene_type:complete